MVATNKTAGKVTCGCHRRNYQFERRGRAQELNCEALIIWKNLFGLLETLVWSTYSSAPEAGERKWITLFQVSGIGMKGADKIWTLHQRALRRAFADEKQLS